MPPKSKRIQKQIGKNGLWRNAADAIKILDDAAELLRYASMLEAEKDKFYELKAQAIDKAYQIAKQSSGHTNGNSPTLSNLAREFGYSTAQIKRYSQVYSLLVEADAQARELLDKEQYWIDALRRKPSIEYIRFAVKSISTAHEKKHPISPSQVKNLWDIRHKTYSHIIKPTDNWNFSRVIYPPQINGSIPGEIYANAFWYFVKPGDTVVDPMAGGGLAGIVYNDRARWQGKNRFDFKLQMFDLTPLKTAIKRNDLLERFPVKRADYVFIDPPYWGMCYGLYSAHPHDIANFDLPKFIQALEIIAKHCAKAQLQRKLCTVLMGNYTDVNNGKVVLLVEHVRNAWQKAGYQLFHVAYAARHIQQTQTTGMANLNNTAKGKRTPLTDMVEVLTFERI